MKSCKRLFAVLMAVLMAVTLAPLNVAFATTGTGTQDDPILISTMVDLKAVLEGLGSDDYPVDAYYKLANDIDTLHEWVFASEANQLKAAEDLDLNERTVPATYKAATPEDVDDTSVTLYIQEDEAFVEYTGERPTVPDDYFVVDVAAHNVRDPLTEEQFAALDSDQRETLISVNGVETPIITPVNKVFTGTFDGNNKTIRGLEIRVANATEAGMFLNIGNKTIIDGETQTKVPGVVKDFTIDRTSVIGLVSSDNALGVSAGSVAATNDGVIQNVTSYATVDVLVKLPVLFVNVGGLIGTNGDKQNGVAVTDCKFGGYVAFYVAEASFEDTSKLSSIDTTPIQIGGIAGSSVDALESDVSSCSFSVNFFGGQNEDSYTKNAGTSPSGTRFSATDIPNEHKVVGNKDEATYFDGGSGTVTKTDPGENDKNRQLITYDYNGDKAYYIRQISCTHPNPQHFDSVTPTCKDAGNVAYWHCDDCDNYFLADPTGTPSAATANYSKDIKLQKDPKNHTDESVTHNAEVAATCSQTGKKENWYCKDCKKYYTVDPIANPDAESVANSTLTIAKDPANHVSVTHKTAKAATCTTDGYKEYWYCSKCKKYFLSDPAEDPSAANVNYNSDVKIAKTGHSYGEAEIIEGDKTYHQYKCTKCDNVKKEKHTFENTVVAPTTKDKGYTLHTCKVCGYSYKDKYTDPLVSSVEVKNSSGYEKKSGYLVTSLPKTKSGITVSEFKANLKTQDVTIRDENGNEVTSGIIKTGYTVEVTGQPKTKLIIAVRGDVNKDGKVSALDYVKVKNHILKKINLSKDKAAFYAADSNADGKISALDYVKIKKLILKGC